MRFWCHSNQKSKFTRKLKWKGKATLNLTEDLLPSLPGYFKIDSEGKIVSYNDEMIEKLQREFSEVNFTNLPGNNEKIYKDEEVQKLTQDDIEELKKERQGDEIIELVKRNNQNFDQRFEFSKKKYLEKKQKKYTLYFYIEECSLANLNLYYVNKQGNYYLPRKDYLAYLLNHLYPKTNENVLLIEKTKGVAAAGILQRMDSSNKLYTINMTSDFTMNKHLEAVQLLNLVDFGKENLIFESFETFIENNRQVDYVCIVADINVPVLLAKITQNLRYNCKIVVFNKNYDIIKSCFDFLLKSDDFIRVDVTDYFYRDYQVLPLRTHPEMKGNLASGYFLTATRIKPKKTEDN